jgi:hypothetical protein
MHLTAENAEKKILNNLCVLSELRGELLCFFLIRSRRGDIAERPLHPTFLGNLMGMNSLIKGLNNPLI